MATMASTVVVDFESAALRANDALREAAGSAIRAAQVGHALRVKLGGQPIEAGITGSIERLQKVRSLTEAIRDHWTIAADILDVVGYVMPEGVDGSQWDNGDCRANAESATKVLARINTAIDAMVHVENAI